jgi:GT2 family glycosyltransferase
MHESGLSIVIPNWNGFALLRRYLPSVIRECDRWQTEHNRECEIIVSDDGSTDQSISWLRANHSGLRVVASSVNRGFGPTANRGIHAARHEIVVLLNNDVAVCAGTFNPLSKYFDDPQIFGVTMRALDLPELKFSTGGKLGRFRRGFWEAWRNYDIADTDCPNYLKSFALVGGFCALRRSMFIELGGFDPLFAPYYWEDIDLSYRARKRAFKITYAPYCVVHHAVSSSVTRHQDQFRREATTHRNRLLFHWKNLDAANLLHNLAWTHLLLLQMAVQGKFSFHAGYVQAIKRLPQVRDFRRAEHKRWRRRDRELEVLASPSQQ